MGVAYMYPYCAYICDIDQTKTTLLYSGGANLHTKFSETH